MSSEGGPNCCSMLCAAVCTGRRAFWQCSKQAHCAQPFIAELDASMRGGDAIVFQCPRAAPHLAGGLRILKTRRSAGMSNLT